MCDRNDEIPCKQRPCRPRPEYKCESSEDVNTNLRGRPVLYTGVVWIGIVRRFLIPRTCGSYQCDQTSTPHESKPPRTVSHTQALEAESDVYEPPLRIQEKPVPLITENREEIKEDLKKSSLFREEFRKNGGSSESPLKAMVIQVQEATAVAVSQARGISQDLGTILRDSQETTVGAIESLRSENGRKFRVAMISGCGLIGLLSGRRRGIVTKLIYSATGATAMATICYPDEAKFYNRRGLATVKRYMVLGFSFVPGVPKNLVGKGDMKISNSNNSSDYEETKNPNENVQPETTSYSTKNIIENLLDNIQTFSHRLNDFKAKLKESSSTTSANESIKENVMSSDSPGVCDSSTMKSLDHNPDHVLPDHLKKISSGNVKTFINDSPPGSVPYSPALPVPPHLTLGLSQHKISQITKDDTHSVDPEEKVVIKCNRSNDSLLSQAADELSADAGDEEENDNDNEQQKDHFDILSDRIFFVIPTGGLDVKLEEIDQLKKTDPSNNNKTPLNKKLSTYYRNIPEEEKTSREKGYDDAYSNRGK